MIVTREQQEKLVSTYNEKGVNTDQFLAFQDGMLAALELVDKIEKTKQST